MALLLVSEVPLWPVCVRESVADREHLVRPQDRSQALSSECQLQRCRQLETMVQEGGSVRLVPPLGPPALSTLTLSLTGPSASQIRRVREIVCASEAGSYFKLIDFCITRL